MPFRQLGIGGLDTMASNALIAPVDGSAGEPEIQSPPTITDQEIGEFREQDRVLPVRNRFQ
jgi:hypothetical protein